MESFDSFAWIRAVRDCKGLSYLAKAVAVVSLLSRRNSMTGVCNPSNDCIKNDAGFKDVRTVQKAIAELVDNGFLSVEKVKGKSNNFVLHMPSNEEVPTCHVPTCDVPPTCDVGTPPTCDVGTPPTCHVGRINKGNKQRNKRDCKAHRLDIETLPYEWFVDCVELQPDLDAYKLFDEFVDFWANVDGKKGMKLDWRRAWKNHLRNLPSWKHENYERKGCFMWDGKPWKPEGSDDNQLAPIGQLLKEHAQADADDSDLMSFLGSLNDLGVIHNDPI